MYAAQPLGSYPMKRMNFFRDLLPCLRPLLLTAQLALFISTQFDWSTISVTATGVVCRAKDAAEWPPRAGPSHTPRTDGPRRIGTVTVQFSNSHK